MQPALSPKCRATWRGPAIFTLLVCMLISLDASAGCGIAQPPPELYVGNDGQCTQSTIQQAIDAATCSYGTNIYITHEVDYDNLRLTVANKKITLIGRSTGSLCGPVAPPICNGVCAPVTTPQVTLQGDDGAGHIATPGSVITITGNSSVGLRFIDIENPTTNGDGGGVRFDGTGSLTLDTTWIRNGHAVNGGAIAFNGEGASTLTIGANVRMSTNQASGSGGAIAATGNATVNIFGPEAVIEDNLATNGYGGGMYVEGPAVTNIGAANTSNPVLYQNRAEYGGGLAIVANGGSSAHAQLFTTNPSLPVEISSNHASHTGGGIYLAPYRSTVNIGNAILCAYDFRLSDNEAANGGAIYGDVSTSLVGDNGSYVNLNQCDFFDGWQPRSELGAVACIDQSHCGSIDGNVATDAGAAVILMQNKGSFEANHFSFIGNEADYGIRTIDDRNYVGLDSCLFADNQTNHELIYSNGETYFSAQDCTFANDLIGATHVIHNPQQVNIITSLFDEQGTLTLDYTGSIQNIYVNYVVSNDITTIPASDAVIQAQAHFVDLAHGDFHLAPDSPGVDFSYGHVDIPGLSATDRDGMPRDVDLPSVTNVIGPRDVGAYERQNLFVNCGRSDSLFCNGFEF